jgi:uncharacterized membrane protein YkgB
MFWLYRIFSLQGVSNLIGVIEIVGALLMVLRPWSGRFAVLDNRSLSVLTPISPVRPCRRFLIKDLAKLGASIWTAAEARRVNICRCG